MKEMWTRIISVVLIVIVARYVGGMFGKNIAEQNTEYEIEEQLQASNDYVSGTCTPTKYYSDFWNIEFQTTENWEMYSDDELGEMNKTLKADTKTKSIEYYERNNIDYDDQMVEEMHKTMVNQYEMGALYYSNGEVVGEITMQVSDALGFSFDEYVNTIYKNATSKPTYDVTSGEQTIVGEKHKTIKAEYTFDGVGMTSYAFFRYKDGIVCTFNCKYSSDNKEVLNSFLTQISTYN